MSGERLRKALLGLADATHGMPLAPRAAATYYYRGRIYLSGAQFEKAAADFAEAIRRKDDFALAYANRGAAFQGQSLHGLALADFRRFFGLVRSVYALHPECVRIYSAQVHILRAVSYKLLGELDRALEDLDTSVRFNPAVGLAWGERGIVHQGLRRPALAIRDMNKAVELEPKNPGFLAGRGFAHFLDGALDRAVADFSRAVSFGADLYAMLFLYLVRARLGHEAATELAHNAASRPTTEWPQPAAAFLLGGNDADWLLNKANGAGEKAEATFYIGQRHLLRGEASEAARWLRRAAAECPPPFLERNIAIIDLEHLKGKTT